MSNVTPEQKLEILMGDIEQISAAASHDLRDGLREGLVLCERLLALTPSPDAAVVIGELESHIRHTIANVGILRQYAYLVQNSEPTSMVPLHDVIVQAWQKTMAGMPNRPAVLQLGETPLPTIEGRAKQLELMCEHLFENALKFNHSAMAQVSVSVQDTGHSVLLTIEDNGDGMEQEFTFLVFGLFKRAEPDGPVKGYGAGLAYAKKIAENHGGAIGMECEPENGCRITLALPKRQTPWQSALELLRAPQNS